MQTISSLGPQGMQGPGVATGRLEAGIAILGAHIDVASTTRIWDSIVDAFPNKKTSSASIIDWAPVNILDVAVCGLKVVLTPLQLGRLYAEPLIEALKE